MRRVSFRLLALVLAMALLLSGCALDFAGYFARLANVFRPVSFENMIYTRPDPVLLDDALTACLESAGGSNLDKLVGNINTLNSICNSFHTNYYLAYIHYSIDMTDSYWEGEYEHCSQVSLRVQAAVDELMYALAASPLRAELEGEEYFGPGYFDDYDGESMWTEEFIALKDQETNLVNQYYELVSLTGPMDTRSETFYSTLGAQMAEVYVQLVQVRQQIAAEAGYDSYTAYAYDVTYSRDYTPEQAGVLLTNIRTELVGLYQQLAESNIWNDLDYSLEDQTFSYVQTMAQAMGGVIQDAFTTMANGGLYHISYGENKTGSSFTVYLPEYEVPFVLVSPTLTDYDKLTFAHEFGHFCNDFATAGSATSIDVGEVFSQGLEYLSLCYADGGETLTGMKLADSLCVYIEQAFVADFETRVYGMSADSLTVENVQTLYGQVAAEYGLGELVDSRNYVNVPHLFNSPLYVISYVVSNDAALQMYQMELEQEGTGLSCYINNLTTQQTGFVAFLQEAGLESPFAEGHISTVKKLFDTVLN